MALLDKEPDAPPTLPTVGPSHSQTNGSNTVVVEGSSSDASLLPVTEDGKVLHGQSPFLFPVDHSVSSLLHFFFSQERDRGEVWSGGQLTS